MEGQEMNDANEKILTRVRQLLAMAADSSSPAEAAIAAGRARKLMDQHQIGLDDLKEANGFGFKPAGEEYRFMPIWQDVLGVGIAKMNDVKMIKQHKWHSTNASYTYQLVFQGYESDVACAVAMYDYLVQTVKRLCAKYISDLGYTKYPARIGDPYKRGAAAELQDRLYSMAKEREQDVNLQLKHEPGTPGTSLVIYKMAQVEAEFGKMKLKDTKAVKVRGNDTLDAMSRGRIDAKNISLNRQLGGGSSNGSIE
jgi:hypothetical protein